jgi:tetratricopeptide (TPR) repeat protein
MNFLKRLFGNKEWAEIPSAFVSAVRDALGDREFAELLKLSRRNALTTEGFFQRAETLGTDLEWELISLAFLLCSLGNALARLHRERDGEQAFQLSLKLKPDHWPASYCLAILYSETGRREQALSCARNALRYVDGAPDKAGGLAIIRDQLATAKFFGIKTGDDGETETYVRDALTRITAGTVTRNQPFSADGVDDLAFSLSVVDEDPHLYTPRGIIYTIGGIANRMLSMGLRYERARTALAGADVNDGDSVETALRQGSIDCLMPGQAREALGLWFLEGLDAAAFYVADQHTLDIDMRSEWKRASR